MNSDELRKLRIKYSLNQSEFARKVGCLPHQVCEWESGKWQLKDRRLAYFKEKMQEMYNQ
jgi:DNA-binding transcriptional regulator YiaG